MYITRLVIRNFRNFELLDIPFDERVTCLIGENNTGKTNLLHALRLALDINLSSQYRVLVEHDIHSGVDMTAPNQVLISVEFSGFDGKVNELALVGPWRVDEEHARVHYRFRPRTLVRDAIEEGSWDGGPLSLEDYHFELTGGGKEDPATVEWDERLGSNIRFSDLQAFQVEYLTVGNEHPTQKPLRLFEIPMEQHTRRGEVVLEPFSGSGSQLIAAEGLGRRCRAMELSPAFVDVAVRRWEQATGKQAILDGSDQTFAEVAQERAS